MIFLPVNPDTPDPRATALELVETPAFNDTLEAKFDKAPGPLFRPGVKQCL